MLKRIRVDVYPSGENNAVKMTIVPAGRARIYLTSLERSLAPFHPRHRKGSAIFILADGPTSSPKLIGESIDPEFFHVVVTEREPSKKRNRLLELDEQRAELRDQLRTLNKEARTIERRIARGIGRE